MPRFRERERENRASTCILLRGVRDPFLLMLLILYILVMRYLKLYYDLLTITPPILKVSTYKSVISMRPPLLRRLRVCYHRQNPIPRLDLDNASVCGPAAVNDVTQWVYCAAVTVDDWVWATDETLPVEECQQHHSMLSSVQRVMTK